MSDANKGIGSKITSEDADSRRAVSNSVIDTLKEQLQQHQRHRIQEETYQQQHHLPSLRIDTSLSKKTKGDVSLAGRSVSNNTAASIPTPRVSKLEDANSLVSLLSPLSVKTPSILSDVLTGAQTPDTDIAQQGGKVPFLCRKPGTGVSVSFQLPKNDVAVHHRHSISCVPVKDRQQRKGLTVDDILRAMKPKDQDFQNNNNNSGGGTVIQRKSSQDEEIQEALDDMEEVEEKSCSVHMPGDFVYLSKENESAVSDTSTRILSTFVPIAPSYDHAQQQQGPFFNTPHESTLSAPTTDSTSETAVPRDRKVIFKKHTPTTTTTETATMDSQIPFTEYFQEEDDNKIHILLGASGSVASIKIPLIIDKLLKIYTPDRVSIQLVVTKSAENFLNNLKISSLVKIWRDEDSVALADGETLLFHELRLWSDIFLIAPLSANTLAKLANGICDNLLTSVFRDWTDTASAPVLIAPAMNTFMYINPMTKKHLNILKESFQFIEVLRPVEKVLVCGDIGMGGMREWSDIVEIVRHRIKEILKTRHENASDREDKEDANNELLLSSPSEEIEEEEEEEEDNDDDDDDDDNNGNDTGDENDNFEEEDDDSNVEDV